MTTEELWKEFLSKINKRVSPITYSCLFKELKLHSYNNSKVIIIVPDNNNNELFLQNLKECYSEIIEEIINDLTNDSCEIEYILNKDLDKLNKKVIEKDILDNKDEKIENISNYNYRSNFNPKYTFDTFVVGESNRLGL